MFISARRFAVATALAVLSFTSAPLNPVFSEDVLTIGSDAPALDVEHWVQDGMGKFKPVEKFEKGKVYVVEFWATWCGPCVASMPHLAELQKEYADKGVQIVSISDEDLETVEKFLERPVRGQSGDDEKKTYRDLTSAYCLTTDPDQSSSVDYMRAAGQNGIPTSFVVGKDSKIEWIGHPMELGDTLAAVVDGSWDREAFAAQFKEKQEMELAMQSIGGLVQAKKFDEALEVIDRLAKKNDSFQFKMMKLQILLMADRKDAFVENVNQMYKALADDPASLNMLAWNLYEMTTQAKIDVEGLVDVSIAATEAAVSKAEKEVKASLLDTLAHYVFKKGDLDKAIKIETEALSLSGAQDREFIENFLEELKAVKAENEEAKDKK